MKRYLETGEIVAVFGIKGEVKVYPWCDTPEFLTEFSTLYKKDGSPLEIERARVQKSMVVMKIKGCDSVEQAQKLRGTVLFMDREDVELEEGSYFIQDLVGMRVEDAASGRVYGVITQVSETGANDVYHVKKEDGSMCYIPAIPQVVAETDVEGGVMKITPLEGLFEE